MSDLLKNLAEMVDDFGTSPSMAEMPHKPLQSKGIQGPTAAHFIEEIHTPLNLAYVTFTTGSTAFQNIVGVTHSELEGRINAALKAFELASVERNSKFLVTYAPLVNVFSAEALKNYGIKWFFLKRSSRDAFLLNLCQERPDVLIGESTFILSSLEDAKRLGLAEKIPHGLTVFTAGTPMDTELLSEAMKYGWNVHDLYGCQEFGWLTLDGIPLRDDISLIPSPRGEQYRELVVGGLPMADSFPYAANGHVCNSDGKIITYRRVRTNPEYEVIVRATKVSSKATIERVARTILRIKARIVRVAPDITLSAPKSILELVPAVMAGEETFPVVYTIVGDEKTAMFDALVEAQLSLQQTSKTDQVWTKKR